MAAVGSPVWGSSVWGTDVWGANVWPGSGVAEEEEAAVSGGGGIMVRTKRRSERPFRDIAYPTPREASFTPIIRDTTARTTTPKGPSLPGLLAAWMALEDL